MIQGLFHVHNIKDRSLAPRDSSYIVTRNPVGAVECNEAAIF
jgi:hypothetical protein